MLILNCIHVCSLNFAQQIENFVKNFDICNTSETIHK